LNFSTLPFLAPSVTVVAPTDYGNLAGWWDADYLTYADATPIDNASAKWTDRSGNNNHLVQATAGNQPQVKTNIINGRKIVRFDGASSPNNDKLSFTSTISLTGDFTIIVVGLVTNDSILFGNSAANQQFRRWRSGVENISIYDGSSDQQSQTFSTAHGSVHAMGWRRTGTALKFRENITNRTGTPTATSLTFTLDRMGITNPVFSMLAGDIAEAIIYTAYRTDAEVDNLYTNYLKAKWGLP